MGFFSAHSSLEDAGIILDEFAYRLSTKAPHTRKLTDPIMLLKSRIFDQHGAAATNLWSLPSRSCIWSVLGPNCSPRLDGESDPVDCNARLIGHLKLNTPRLEPPELGAGFVTFIRNGPHI
jgi:hypothetical protein